MSKIFQSINSVRSNNLSLKYQRFTPSDCTEVGIRIFEFVTKTQILYKTLLVQLCDLVPPQISDASYLNDT